jgi:radical SAM superfamily enzyme YgiQ (UPF0313 family)
MRVLFFEVNPYLPPTVPISLGYISAKLNSMGHETKLVNLAQGGSLSLAGLRGLVMEFRPALVGFSVYQRNILHVLGLCRAIKEIDGNIRTILGGPQATFLPKDALNEMPHVDYVCRGEGEVVIANVVEAMEGGALDEPVRGAACRLSPDHWAEGGPVSPPEDLDAHPSPYLTETLEAEKWDEVILLTSRGCPYGCVFCYTPMAFSRRVRFHSTERVLEEMSFLNKKGIRRFWIADPSFTCNRAHSEEILEGVIRRGIKGAMWLETRADLVDREIAALMGAAGVRQVAFGLESASEEVLETLGKGVSPKEVKEAVRLVMAEGMDVELFSQYGLPGESFKDAQMTLEFVKGLVPIKGNTNAQQMRLYFGSEIEGDPARWGIIPLDEKRPPYISVGERYETRWMSFKEIQRIAEMWRDASLDGGKRFVS